MKKKVWIILASALAAFVIVALAGVCFLLPYLRAQSSMPENQNMTITENEDGSLRLDFPAANQASFYTVDIFEPVLPAPEGEEQPDPVMLFSQQVLQTSCMLPELPNDRELTIRVTPAVEYGTPVDQEIRYGENSLEVTTVIDAPHVSHLVWKADDASKTVNVSFEMREGDVCTIHSVSENGEKTEISVLDLCKTDIKFGENGDMPMPEYDETYNFTLTAHRNSDGIDFYGYTSADFSVVREDLLGRDLALKMTDEGNNVFSFTWQETKGEYYKVQVTNEYTEDWVTLCEIPRDGERTYKTPHLEPFQTYEYRVLAVGGQVVQGRKTAAESEVLKAETKESAIFCTVWPVIDLEAYSDTAKTQAVGTALTSTAYCVVEEKDGMFGVLMDGKTAYIDSSYCMINLPEYIGDLCIYKITNSYDSIYMVHEYEIPDVTGVITKGYWYVEQNDGSYLVPLLYPTAQKLINAANSAMEKGYKLKIYDAFRPHDATREIYDLTEKILKDPIPDYTYTGKDVDLSEIDLPEEEEPDQPATPENGEAEEKEEQKITYELLMTNNKYGLSNFLAAVGSTHNQGVALDITMVDIETGYEVSMQTSIHDLSWYSVLYRNNSAADVLAEIMTGAGFGDLVSEWWHFQDNDARSTLELPYVTGGINAECWVMDDYGVRYRNADGTYLADTTVTIGETEYKFDANGYVAE